MAVPVAQASPAQDQNAGGDQQVVSTSQVRPLEETQTQQQQMPSF
jgi:hypothetical protein